MKNHFYHDGDDYDALLDRCRPGFDQLQPAPRRLPRRVLGALLLAALLTLQYCS